jgi:hypothetical protein
VARLDEEVSTRVDSQDENGEGTEPRGSFFFSPRFYMQSSSLFYIYVFS